MFDLERWEEIFSTITKNKLRTFLTGLSVGSGIFILVILLGVGQGLQNGISQEFKSDATNRIWVWANITSKEYKGLNPGRQIKMTHDNYEGFTAQEAEKLEFKTSILWVNANLITYKKESVGYNVQGVNPDNQFIENQSIISGRYLNQNDIDNSEKVVVISRKIARELFVNGEAPVNEYIKISDINFKVIGIYTDVGGEDEEEIIAIPITTAQKVFGRANRISNMALTVKPSENLDQTLATSTEVTENVLNYLKEAHSIAPDDLRAVNAFNTLKEVKRYFTLIENIKLFFWIVGICTIIAGN